MRCSDWMVDAGAPRERRLWRPSFPIAFVVIIVNIVMAVSSVTVFIIAIVVYCCHYY